MTYNLAYDFCAIPILLILLVISRSQRQAPFLQNRRYRSLVICVLGLPIADILDVLGTLYTDIFPPIYLYLTSYLYFAFLCLTPFFILIYAISLKEITPDKDHKLLAATIYGPGILWALFLATNFLHHSIFVYDENWVYHRGPLQIINYVMAFYYVVYALGFIQANKKVIDVKSARSVTIFAILGMAASAFQVMFEKQLVVAYFVAISVLIIFLTVQRPDTYLDGLTGQLNKSTFARLFEFYRTSKKDTGLVFVYIEDLKLANQAIGVDRVNDIMRQVGEFLEGYALNRTFYLGVSTYVIITDAHENINNIAAQIQRRFEEKWTSDEASINLSCRTLVLEVPKDVDDLEEVYAYNQCLIDASGYEYTHFNAADLNIDSAKRRLLVEAAIKRAIAEDNFVMYYQPIVSTETEKVVSAEALIRLIDPELGFIPPDEFIPIAEKNGSILKIGEIVFKNVFKFIKENDLQSKGVEYIEINLSVVQCMQDDMSEKLVRMMKEYGVETGRINLEITETAAIESSRTLVKNMNFLTNENVSFSLDDFGSGYSNMNSVLDLPLDMIKFDKHMVDVATEKEKGKIVLASSATMIKRMDMKIVAEGVETAEQVEEMKKMGVDYIQGYFYSRPVPAQAFVEFVNNFNDVA